MSDQERITEHFWYGSDRLVFSHSVAEARATLPTAVLVALEATGHAQHGWSDFHLHRADESPLPRWQEGK